MENENTLDREYLQEECCKRRRRNRRRWIGVSICIAVTVVLAAAWMLIRNAGINPSLQAGETTVPTTTTAAVQTQPQETVPEADTVLPVLELSGDAQITLHQWKDYEEPGYAAMDDRDGDISARITLTGTVDVETPGTYTLEYSVTDDGGNTASAYRTVVVQEWPQMPDMPMGDFAEPVQPEEKVIYLTFDDGPGDHTPRLLGILERYDVKATFFVVNTGCVEYVAEIAAAGHTVAMHSASHRYEKIYVSETAYFEDLYEIQNLIYRHTGQISTILRFPGGGSNSSSINYNKGIMTRLAGYLEEMGYRYFDWNVDSRDATSAKTADEVYRNVTNQIWGKDVAVVLQHDIYGFSVDAVERIIQWGLSNGYTFKALDTSSPVCEQPIKN